MATVNSSGSLDGTARPAPASDAPPVGPPHSRPRPAPSPGTPAGTPAGLAALSALGSLRYSTPPESIQLFSNRAPDAAMHYSPLSASPFRSRPSDPGMPPYAERPSKSSSSTQT